MIDTENWPLYMVQLIEIKVLRIMRVTRNIANPGIGTTAQSDSIIVDSATHDWATQVRESFFPTIPIADTMVKIDSRDTVHGFYGRLPLNPMRQ